MQQAMKDVETGTTDPVLVVDMDGTLVRTDTLHESLLSLAASDPASLFGVVRHGIRDKAAFKSALADTGQLDPALLPYNEDVLDAVRAARVAGRRTALVSASDARQVRKVAEHLDLFDEVHGSDGTNNLAGSAKAAFLIETFGEKGFDYMGDSSADLPVWQVAAGGAVVQPKRGVKDKALAASPDLGVLETDSGRMAAWLRAVRPHQWSKNALIFLPLLAAHQLGGLPLALIAFVAFSLTASSIYVLNDLLDLPSDRAHPRKKNRPFAAGRIGAAEGLLGAGVLLCAALFISLLGVGLAFTAVLFVYLVATSAYSLALKRRPLVDVMTLAGLYTLRIYAGAVATGVALSPWMLGFSIFFFLSLAAVKRQAELVDMVRTERISAGRGYQVEDLPIVVNLAMSTGVAAILVLAIYISSDDVQQLYGRPELLWFVCPLLLYWSVRMVLKAHRGQMTDDPIVFAASDKVSLLVVGLTAAVVILAAA